MKKIAVSFIILLTGIGLTQGIGERSTSVATAEEPKTRTYRGTVLDCDTGEGISGVSVTARMNYRCRYVWTGGNTTYSQVMTTTGQAVSGSGGAFSVQFHLDSGVGHGYSWAMFFDSWGSPSLHAPWALESRSGSTLYVFRDADRNSIRDEYEAQLAEKFAPSLVLHSRDHGVSPEPVEIMGVDMTEPGAYLWARIWNSNGQLVDNRELGGYEFKTNQKFSFDFFAGPRAIYPDGNYSSYPGHISGGMSPPGKAYGWYHLTLHPAWAGPNGNDPDTWYAAYEEERIHNHYPDTIYCHLFRQGDEIVIQYWFFYPFNACVNRHEGDWEHINVVVTSQDPYEAEITRIDYCFHHWVMVREVPGVDYLVMDETHPLVFVGGYASLYLTGEGTWQGAGSHGSYPMCGTWVDIGPTGPRLPSCDENVDGQGRYIPYHKFDLVILPDKDKIDYKAHPELSWLKANIQWGHLMVASAGQKQLNWAHFFNDLLFNIPEIFIDLPHDVGNLAPLGPAHNPGWNRTGPVGEAYKVYDKTPPPTKPWTPPLRLENPGFEEGLDFWETYGDGIARVTTETAFNGSHSAQIQRDTPTGHYFGFYQEDIVVEPDTEYRLSLWVKTRATSGRIAGGFGVWSSDPALNHHNDFGHISGTTDWVQIHRTWRSRPDEHLMRVMLFGTPEFVGEAWFDGLVLEEVEPRHGGFEKDLDHWAS
jgi:hypothetical protein